MRICRIDITGVRVPARPGSVHSADIRDSLDTTALSHAVDGSYQFDDVTKLIYRIHTDCGVVGIGESYRSVDVGLVTRIAQSLIGEDPLSLNLQSLPMPVCREYDGFEVAICDLVGKIKGVPVNWLLGGSYRSKVRSAFWSGRRTSNDAAKAAKQALAEGYDTIKFKVGPEDDPAAWCEAIRKACDDKIMVSLDPNQRWGHPSQVKRFLRRLERTGIVLALEDPVPRWNLDWWRELRATSDIPLALHIHLPYYHQGQSPTDLIRAIKAEALDYVNVGGGLFAFHRLASMAATAGIQCWHGSEVDLGILEAGYLHAAASVPNCTLPSDIFGELVREDDLIIHPLEYDGKGSFVVPEGPGLGVELDLESLEKYRVDVPGLGESVE